MNLFVIPLIVIGTFAVCVMCASLFEWTLHRYVMHRPFFNFTYPCTSHRDVHHKLFKADHTYHVQKEEDKKKIPMAWWNGFALVSASSLPFWIIGYLVGHIWIISIPAVVTFAAYYATYEYIHWCMHLPRKRNVERTGIFFRLNGHHLLHHRYMHKNFNVVLPLADLCLGTFLARSKTHFKQAEGPSVPNVQPLSIRIQVAS